MSDELSARVHAALEAFGDAEVFYVFSPGCQYPHTIAVGEDKRWTSLASSPWQHPVAERQMIALATMPALLRELAALIEEPKP